MSIPEEDVTFLDMYARKHGLRSRSAAITQAVRVLRVDDLKSAYGEAWAEWDESTDADLWDSTVDDGA